MTLTDFDFFGEAAFPLGHDVITLGMVLHDWGLPRKLLLMRRCASRQAPSPLSVPFTPPRPECKRGSITPASHHTGHTRPCPPGVFS